MAEYLGAEATAALNLPFSEAVRVGDILYLSGVIGVLPGTRELPPGGIEAETRQAMENIKERVERYGSSMDRIIRCTIMLADMAEWERMNQVYVTYFPNHRPARSAFGASGLALGARVEIECTAVAR
ncbi:MAG: RidA family protein [Gemmatimonadetes bacterium]|nr:RidA family protein [Gemmatimonadota bacterium]